MAFESELLLKNIEYSLKFWLNAGLHVQIFSQSFAIMKLLFKIKYEILIWSPQESVLR